MIFRTLIVSLTLCVMFTACGQTQKQPDKIIGGRCEGCEAALEFENKKLISTDTLPGFNNGSAKLEISGTIFKADGKTPAANVILYIYHTDQAGIYPTQGNETGWGKRHGYIRGWIRTSSDGKYKFFTQRPGAYPGRENPEHIHATIKEEGMTPYYIDEYLFDDDKILTAEHRERQENRGGNGIMKVSRNSKGMLVIKRDIILGKNIPDYR